MKIDIKKSFKQFMDSPQDDNFRELLKHAPNMSAFMAKCIEYGFLEGYKKALIDCKVKIDEKEPIKGPLKK